MAETLLTKKIEFAAAHRYHNPKWDAARNRTVFGACNNEHGHGHNYFLEVTVAGEVDPQSGMVVNLYDLKKVLEEVLEGFDHKHLNLDTPYFKDKIPTTENIAQVFWSILKGYPAIGRVERVRVYENDDLFAEVTAEMATGGLLGARITRRYHFSAAHRAWSTQLSNADNRRFYGSCSDPNGHNYVLSVSVRGEIEAETGMVIDIRVLDQIVRDAVIKRVDHKDLNQDADLRLRPTTGENLAAFIWTLLAKSLPLGALERIALAQTRDLSFEYSEPAPVIR